MLIKRAAGALNLVAGAWIIYVVLFASRIRTLCPVTGCAGLSVWGPLFPVLLVGVLLVVDSGICFVEKWFAFPLGGLLSVITIVLVVSQWSVLEAFYVSISIVISVVALILDAKAAVSQSRLSEQEHPLNLPVFG